MTRKLFGIFDKRPLIWFHYVLLTGILFIAFYAANRAGLVSMSTTLSASKWLFLFAWYFLFISIGDQLIHRILGVD